MAPSGDGATAERVRARLDEQGEGLASLCFRVDGIDKFQRRLKRLGLAPEDVAQSGSTNAIDGATLAWKRTRTAVEATHGTRLFFLELAGERPRSQATAGAPIIGLDHVVVSTNEPERAAALYGARLGLDMTLDLSRPDWGARLMFFRCGDLVVEVVHRLNEAGDGTRQALGPELARGRHRRRAGAAVVIRPRRVRDQDRPPAGHARLHGAHRRARRADTGHSTGTGELIQSPIATAIGGGHDLQGRQQGL